MRQLSSGLDPVEMNLKNAWEAFDDMTCSGMSIE